MRGTVAAVLRAWCVVVAVSTFASAASAQTPPPGRPLAEPLAIDLAPGWIVGDRALANQAFTTRMGTGLADVLHPLGSRMSDSPYALIDFEHWRTPGLPNGNQQRTMADAVAGYFKTPLSPPSKAERSPAWKKGKVGTIAYDPANNRFRFDATITFDFDGDRHVNVQGLFHPKGLYVLAVWSDDAYHQQHGPALAAMRDSFRFTTGNVNPIESAKQSFLSKTRWFVGFIVVAVVAAQVVILVRERRQRRAERERLLDSVSSS
jgi:hypothetical protein